MSKLLLACLSVLPLLGICTSLQAETAVIVHPSNESTLTMEHVNKIFLGKSKSFPNGNSAHPINQKEGSESRAAFDNTVLEKSPSQVKAYWSKLLFTGKGTPPKEAGSAAEMKQMVAGDPEAIGYIDAAQIDDSVKVVLTF